jgi:hypothetical protein
LGDAVGEGMVGCGVIKGSVVEVGVGEGSPGVLFWLGKKAVKYMPTDKDAVKTAISATAKIVLLATELKNSHFTFFAV